MSEGHFRIFYSWQSDLPNSTNRGFIDTALHEAAKRIREDDSIEIEPVVDRDTQGLPGSPDIARAIFDKIDQTDLLVCDVSIVRRAEGGRPCPNPNVLIELGYGLKALGHEQIVLVSNVAFGPVEQLPFDLRMRRAMTYEMSEDATSRADERRRLSNSLEGAIRAVLKTGLRAMVSAPEDPFTAAAKKAVQSIDGARPDQGARCRDFMVQLLLRLRAKAPTTGDVATWDEAVLTALGQTVEEVETFGRVAEIAAAMNAGDALRALHRGFGGLLDCYRTPKGFSGSFREWDFDYFKFLGHELFVILVAHLLREDRLEILADVLSQPLYVENGPRRTAGSMPFSDLSEFLRSLDHRNERLKLNRLSVHADILNERHANGPLAQAIAFAVFMEADYFLYLRGELEKEGAGGWITWKPWSALYMKDPPRFILQAEGSGYADRLARALGAADVADMKSKLAERAPYVEKLFRGGFWDHPIHGYDLNRVAFR